MLTAKIINDGVGLELHGEHQHLSSGSIVKAVNAIDTFTFSMLPSNQCFDQIQEFSTLVKVWNEHKKRYDFQGRAFFPTSSMTSEGLLARQIVCEGFLAFLCDSCQKYVAEQEWEAETLLAHILTCHNSQLEEYKHISIGTVNVVGTVTTAIDRENSWDSIQNKLIANLGGEINLRVEDDGLYLDYLQRIGETKETAIALSHNMKAIEQERDPSEYVTRLIPLGQKLEDSEERVTIATANNGVEYIDDEAAKAKYGIRVDYVEFDEISDPAELKAAGKAWMAENNRIKVKYSITALDLSLLGLDVDDFELYNSHPIQNRLLGIGDTARIIRKTTDVCDPARSAIEVGENFKTFSDLQREAAKRAEEEAKRLRKEMLEKAGLDPNAAQFALIPAGRSKGDVNGDGVVDNIDAMMAVQHFVGIIALTGEALWAADANGDGTVDNIDAGLISRKAVGLEAPSFVMGVLDENSPWKADAANQYYYCDLAVDGLTAGQAVTLIPEKAFDADTYIGAESLDGKLRIKMRCCPVEANFVQIWLRDDDGSVIANVISSKKELPQVDISSDGTKYLAFERTKGMVWEEASNAGGATVNIVQETGESETSVMSQKAVTQLGLYLENKMLSQFDVTQESGNNSALVMSQKAVTDYAAAKTDIPTKLSQLSNDRNFVTSSSVPTKLSHLQNDVPYAKVSEIPAVPTKLSQLTNDADYIPSTKFAAISSSAVTYAKISGFGNWGQGAWYDCGFTMLIGSRGGEQILFSLSSDDSNKNAKAIRLLNVYSKIIGVYYSLSESAVYVKANAWCNNVAAHVLSNVKGDFVPAVEQVSTLPSDLVEVNIVELGCSYNSTNIGASSLALSLTGLNPRPTYNGNTMALYSDVEAANNGGFFFANVHYDGQNYVSDKPILQMVQSEAQIVLAVEAQWGSAGGATELHFACKTRFNRENINGDIVRGYEISCPLTSGKVLRGVREEIQNGTVLTATENWELKTVTSPIVHTHGTADIAAGSASSAPTGSLHFIYE